MDHLLILPTATIKAGTITCVTALKESKGENAVIPPRVVVWHEGGQTVHPLQSFGEAKDTLGVITQWMRETRSNGCADDLVIE